MKVRIKFAKEGPTKFIGHLDTMRYFQKAIRRAGLPIAYSGGFSPHMIMSFAAPLGVGVTSSAEYFDMELIEELSTNAIRDRLNQVMADGFTVVSARKTEEGKASKAMSLVAAADYRLTFREEKAPAGAWEEKVAQFYSQPSIFVWKKTKRSEKEVDIRPYIYQMDVENHQLYLRLASASSNYTKPELVMDTFLTYLQEEPKPFSYMVHRQEIYTITGEETAPVFVSLEELGEEVE